MASDDNERDDRQCFFYLDKREKGEKIEWKYL